MYTISINYAKDVIIIYYVRALMYLVKGRRYRSYRN